MSTLIAIASLMYPYTNEVRNGRYTMRGLAGLKAMLNGSGEGLFRYFAMGGWKVSESYNSLLIKLLTRSNIASLKQEKRLGPTKLCPQSLLWRGQHRLGAS